jgi:hypothetical protein
MPLKARAEESTPKLISQQFAFDLGEKHTSLCL